MKLNSLTTRFENITPALVFSALFVAITAPCVIWVVRNYLRSDFWYDELFTLGDFVLVPLRKTLTDYGAPNNHIFFNLVNNLYLRLLGITELAGLTDAPHTIRLLPVLYGLVTAWYLYRIGATFFHRAVGWLALAVLVTTVPFYNFLAQVRGYTLSMMLVSMLIYAAWQWERAPRPKHAAGIVFCAVLALYAIPLNLYVLLALLLFYVLVGCRRDERRQGTRATLRGAVNRRARFCRLWRERKPYWGIAGLLGGAIFLAGLIYLPFYANILNNRHFESHGLFRPETLTTMMPEIWWHLFSHRYALIPLAVFGGLLCVAPGIRRRFPASVRHYECCAFLLCAPFVFSCLRGDRPPSRVFVNLTPIFALWVAIGGYLIVCAFPKIRLNALTVGFLVVYCHLAFIAAIIRKDERLKADVLRSAKQQNIYYNYFQAYYHPSRLIRDFLRSAHLDRIPLTLVVDAEEFEMRTYLEVARVRYFPHPSQILFNQEGQAYVFTAFGKQFHARLTDTLPGVHCTPLNADVNYHQFFLCRYAPDTIDRDGAAD